MNTEINNILSRLNDSINLDNKLLISIILPVYNTEKYLNRCLDSIFLQQENDLEVIIVNDCSPNTDLCRDIVHSYINNSYNVIYIENKENLGSAWSRLNDLSYARGKYIHFVDSDDWLHKDLYKIIKKYLKKIMIFCILMVSMPAMIELGSLTFIFLETIPDMEKGLLLMICFLMMLKEELYGAEYLNVL